MDTLQPNDRVWWGDESYPQTGVVLAVGQNGEYVYIKKDRGKPPHVCIHNSQLNKLEVRTQCHE